MRARIASYLENISESACACLIAMVQGNVLALTTAHWVVAAETGLLAGTIASTALFAARFWKQPVVSLTLGVVTMLIDFLVHGVRLNVAGVLESVVTGAAAAALSLVVGRALLAIRRARPFASS